MPARGWLLTVLLTLLASPVSAASADVAVPEPAGYRLSDYRAPTPETLAGAIAVDTPTAQRLVTTQAALPIYVLKLDRSTLPGRPWLSGTPPDQIPGGIWLPNVGVGQPGPEIEDYLRRALDRLAVGRDNRGAMFYCLADCWMSWNAAKRALSLGYRPVYWYRDGMDGWTGAGLPTQRTPPLPIDAQP